MHRAQAPRKFAWLGSVPGLVHGEHKFELVPREDGKPGVRLLHSEEFTGCAAGFFEWLNGAFRARRARRSRRSCCELLLLRPHARRRAAEGVRADERGAEGSRGKSVRECHGVGVSR